MKQVTLHVFEREVSRVCRRTEHRRIIMEGVHLSKQRPWICQEKIHVESFIQDCDQQGLRRELKKPSFSIDDIVKQAAQDTGKPAKEWMDEVAQDCHVDLLKCEGEVGFQNAKTVSDLVKAGLNDDDICLETVKAMRKISTNKRNKTFIRQDDLTRVNSMKSSLRNFNHSEKSGKKAVLTVELYRPRNNYQVVEFMSYYNRRFESLQFELELDVLSSQTLADFRKFISCPSDFATVPDEVTISSLTPTYASEVFTSGFFFINDTFYNDLSKPEKQVDYSRVIREWAEKEGQGIGPFKTALMHETQLKDLTIQLGYPYVYVHQGNCEHLFIFKDIKLFDRNKASEKDFPKIVRCSRKTRTKCFMCKHNTASFIIENDDSLPCDPAFFCDDCRAVYYKHAGEPKDLKVESYVDMTALI